LSVSVKELKNRYVGTWMPKKLVKEIDEAKGDISRNLFIKRAVIEALKEQQQEKKRRNER
jgi:metal-responsive CopG/Arc/MetJ family transcriptional regulator